MATYNRTDKWPELWDISEKLANLADPNEDCLSALCSLSKEGTWETSDDGKLVYKAPVEVDESAQITETGVLPIESYTAGDSSIPTRVARKLGLGEYVVCKNAGYILQGESIIDRAVYRATAEHGEGRDFNPTTLSEMLQEDSEDDIYWTSLEWRHLQSVVDDSGGQACRFEVLASILKCLAQPGMDSETFVPYGHQFADSDFVDSIQVNDLIVFPITRSECGPPSIAGQSILLLLPSSKRLSARYQAGDRTDAVAVQWRGLGLPQG